MRYWKDLLGRDGGGILLLLLLMIMKWDEMDGLED